MILYASFRNQHLLGNASGTSQLRRLQSFNCYTSVDVSKLDIMGMNYYLYITVIKEIRRLHLWECPLISQLRLQLINNFISFSHSTYLWHVLSHHQLCWYIRNSISFFNSGFILRRSKALDHQNTYSIQHLTIGFIMVSLYILGIQKVLI